MKKNKRIRKAASKEKSWLAAFFCEMAYDNRSWTFSPWTQTSRMFSGRVK
jgi:hypothetical protein